MFEGRRVRDETKNYSLGSSDLSSGTTTSEQTEPHSRHPWRWKYDAVPSLCLLLHKEHLEDSLAEGPCSMIDGLRKGRDLPTLGSAVVRSPLRAQTQSATQR